MQPGTSFSTGLSTASSSCMRKRRFGMSRGHVAASSIDIVHQIEGRVRFQLPGSMFDARKRAGIEAAFDSDSRVTRYRFNPHGRYLVVEHEPKLGVRTLRKLIARARASDPVDRPHPGNPDRHIKSLIALGARGALALAGPPLALPLIGLGSTAI